MRHREDWKDLSEDEGWGYLRRAIASKPVDWSEISDLLWWARAKEEKEGGDGMQRYLDYLRYHLCEYAVGGSGWYAGERKVWIFGGVEFAMRWIPAGRFLMGSGEEDTEAWDEEKPQREVTITRGFWMGETPITQRQYKAITGENPSYFPEAGLDAPVEGVNWYGAAAFTNELSEIAGLSACFVGNGEQMRGVGNEASDYLDCKGWRLPTEAEWEYAARAGTTTPRYGDVNQIGWWGAFYGKGNSQVSYARGHARHGKKWGTHPVGEKEANAWGFFDMLGNVLEWCYDLRGSYSSQAATDPVQSSTDSNRVLRGGSWFDIARYMRAAYRKGYAPSAQDSLVGFRVVKSGD